MLHLSAKKIAVLMITSSYSSNRIFLLCQADYSLTLYGLFYKPSARTSLVFLAWHFDNVPWWHDPWIGGWLFGSGESSCYFDLNANSFTLQLFIKICLFWVDNICYFPTRLRCAGTKRHCAVKTEKIFFLLLPCMVGGIWPLSVMFVITGTCKG